MEKKRLDLKDKVNFEIYDVTVRLTNNGNTHIAQSHELKASRQRVNQSVNRTSQEKYFYLKVMQKIRQGS